jgi:hypothetical protein
LYTFPIILSATPARVTVTLDELRGEIVDVNAETMSVSYPSALEVCSGPAECYVVGNPRFYDYGGTPSTELIDGTFYQNWSDAGTPGIWCCPHHGYGDANGDGWTNVNDYSEVVNFLGQRAVNNPKGDVNHDGWINVNDYSPIVNNLGQGDNVPCPPLP